jgi:hypothetical protein
VILHFIAREKDAQATTAARVEADRLAHHPCYCWTAVCVGQCSKRWPIHCYWLIPRFVTNGAYKSGRVYKIATCFHFDLNNELSIGSHTSIAALQFFRFDSDAIVAYA